MNEIQAGRDFVDKITDEILSNRKIKLLPEREWFRKRWLRKSDDGHSLYLCTTIGETTIDFDDQLIKDCTDDKGRDFNIARIIAKINKKLDSF